MTRTVVAVVCAVLALVAGCGSTGGGAAPTSASTTADDAAVMSSAVAAAGIPPKPDDATRAAYLNELRAIEPQLVDEDNPDKAVSRGRDQCKSVGDTPNDQARLVDLTNRRFTAPTAPDGFGPEVAERVLAVVRKHLCPTY